MDPSIYFAFGTELLRAFNMAQANKSADQVRAEAIIAWGVAKPILHILLPSAIKDQLKAAGINF